MAKRDVIDAEAARRMAWSFVQRGEKPRIFEAAAPAETAGSSPPGGVERADTSLEDHHEEMCAVADEVRRAWAISDRDAQAEATRALTERLAAPRRFPLGFAPGLVTTRLVRLLVRHWDALDEDAREDAARALTLVALEADGELDRLVEELARAGNTTIARVLSVFALPTDLHVAYPALGARLACLLDDAPNARVHRVAIAMLGCGKWPEAVPALRRAARSRWLTVRPYAIAALLAYSPPALPEETLVWLLEDAVKHPPPRRALGTALAQRAYDYADVLKNAVRAIAPRAGAEPLLRIARGECANDAGWRAYLDASWALATLAAGYPEVARPLVARAARSSDAHVRMQALTAVAELDDAPARPLLRALAADPRWETADAAERAYLARFGATPPVAPLDGIATELLEAPPSDAFVARLAALRGTTPGARAALAEALLAEAGSREALVLLGRALAAGDLWYTGREALPKGPGAWAVAIVERFGEAGGDLLLWFAETYPSGSTSAELFGLPRAFHDRIRPGTLARMRALAVDRALEGQRDRTSWVLALRRLGMDPARWEPAFELLEAMASDLESGDLVGMSVAELPPCAALDARLARAAAAAREAGDLVRLEAFATVGLARGVAAVAAEVRRALDEAREVGASLLRLGGRAFEHGCIDGAWIRAAVEAPDAPAFVVAACELSRRTGTAPEVEAALFRALDGAPSAAEAACIALVRTSAIATDDPRVDAVLARVDPLAQARVLEQCMAMDTPFAALRPRVEALLRSDDPAVCDAVYGAFTHLRDDPDWLDVLRANAAAMSGTWSKHHAARVIGAPGPVATYWLDAPAKEGDADVA